MSCNALEEEHYQVDLKDPFSFFFIILCFIFHFLLFTINTNTKQFPKLLLKTINFQKYLQGFRILNSLFHRNLQFAGNFLMKVPLSYS